MDGVMEADRSMCMVGRPISLEEDAVVVAVEMWGMVWCSGCPKGHFPISPSFFSSFHLKIELS